FGLRRTLSHLQTSDRGRALTSHRRGIASPRPPGTHPARHVRCGRAVGPRARPGRSSLLLRPRAHADQGRRSPPIAAARCAPPRSHRCRADRPSLERLGLRGLRHHGAAERFLDGVLELILRLDGESAILLETFGIENALFSHPAQSPNTQRDDVNGQACNFGMQLLAKLAWRTSTGLFAVGNDNNEAGLVAGVEHICRLWKGPWQRRVFPRRPSPSPSQDGWKGGLLGPETGL